MYISKYLNFAWKKKDEKYNGTNISIFLGKVILSQQLLHVPDVMKKFM